MTLSRVGGAVLVLAAFFMLPACSLSQPLNDTAYVQCVNASFQAVSCSSSDAVPGQDALVGRDAAVGAGLLRKQVGAAGQFGFEFMKISNRGDRLPLSAARGSAPGDWGCTLDVNTGLMWEIKTDSGLRGRDHAYKWYDSNPATNGGNAGSASEVADNRCETGGRCDTEKFATDVNVGGICGSRDWRMPTFREFFSIWNVGVSLDQSFFPDGINGPFWTASTKAATPAEAWHINNGTFFYNPYGKAAFLYVRLVRNATN